MTVLLSTLAIAVLALLAVAVRAWARVAERQVALEERRVALEEARVKRDPSTIEIPAGLLRLAQQETELWAQESVKARIRELYADLGAWDKVTVAISQEMAGGSGEVA